MTLFSPLSTKLSLLIAVFALAASASASTISATVTVTPKLVSPGVYDYSLTLDNTGTTSIGTLWFSWVPGAGFLSAPPTDILMPTGWTDTVTNGGKAVRWVAGTGSSLAAGWSISGFSFESTETPAQLMLNYTGAGAGHGDPVLTSTVYAGAPFVGADDIFDAKLVATPEPGTLLLTLTGMGLAVSAFKSRLLGASLS